MKIKVILIISFISLHLSSHCQQLIRSTKLNEFTSIELSGNLSVEIAPSNARSIDIEVIEGEINRFKWGISKGVLKAATKDNKTKVTIKICYTDLQKIDISQATIRNSEALGSSSTLDITANNGAIINLNIDCTDTNLYIKGNSIAQFKGKSTFLKIEASDKSKLDMRSLICSSADVTASSAAEVYLICEQRLIANTKGGAKIMYMGEPEVKRLLGDNISPINFQP